MAQDLQLQIRINADGSAAVQGIRRVTDETEQAGEAADQAGDAFSGLSTSVKLMAAAAVTVGLATLKKTLTDIANEASTVQQNMLRTEAILQATGSAAGYSADQLYEQARALAYATLQSTEGVQQAQQVMLTFKSVVGDTFERAIELAADMSATIGQGLTSSVTQLGKALEDPVKGLSALARVGVSFSESQQELIKTLAETNRIAEAQGIILDAIAGQMGGVARREAEGYAGAINTLGQKWQELLLTLDRKMDVLERATNMISGLTNIVGAASNYLDGLGFQNFDSDESAFNALLARRMELQQEYFSLQQKIEALSADNSRAARQALNFLNNTLRNTAQEWGDVEVKIRAYQQAAKDAAVASDKLRDSAGGAAGDTAAAWSDSDEAGLQSVLAQYVPGTKALNAFTDAQERVNAAVAAGRLTNAEAADLMAQVYEQTLAAAEAARTNADQQDVSADAMARYAQEAATALNLTAEQRGVLAQVIPELDAMAEAYGVTRERIIGIVAAQTGFVVSAEQTSAAIQLLEDETGGVMVKLTAGFDGLLTGAIDLADVFGGDLARNSGLTTEQLVQMVKQSASLTKEMEQLSARYGTVSAAAREHKESTAEINALYALGEMSAREYAAALEDIRLEYQRSQGPIAAYLADLEASIGGLEDIAVTAMDSFTDALVDGLVEGELEFDDFVDTIKRKLAEMAVNTIVVNIVGNVTGLTGGSGIIDSLLGGSGASASGVGGAVSGVGSGVSGLGSLGNIGSMLTGNSLGGSLGTWLGANTSSSLIPTSGVVNLMGTSNLVLGGSAVLGSLFGSALFDGGYSDIGSSIGSTAGAVIGSMILPGIGTAIGSLIGGAGGGFLGSLFGDDTPRFGGYATSFSGAGFEDNVSAQGAFGLNFGVSDKGSKNIDAGEYQSALDGLATVSQALSDFYGSELSETVQIALRDTLGDFNDWGDSLDEQFYQLFGTIVQYGDQAAAGSDDLGSLLATAVAASGGLRALGDDAQSMTNVLAGGMEIVNGTVALFDTEVGKLMGLGTEFDTLSESVAAMTWYVQAFWQEGETSASMIQRFSESMSVLYSAFELTGDQLDELGFSALNLMIIAEDLRQSIADVGLTMADFASLQSSYFQAAYSEAERAEMQAEAARAAIAEWNAEMGLTGEATIDSLADLRAYLEGLDEYSTDYNDLYVSAINASGAFISLEDALSRLSGAAGEAQTSVDAFIESLKPEELVNAEAIAEMIDLFAQWGMQIPATSDALYALIQAGAFTDEQLRILADNADLLGIAWGALAEETDRALAALKERYDAAVAAAKTASAERIDALREDSNARIDALRAESGDRLDALRAQYDALTDSLNTQIDAAREALGTFEDVVDAAAKSLRDLREQAETQPDETRQRLLEEARAALEQFAKTGTLPDDIADIIGGLGSVDPNDFATREEWLAAIAENEGVIGALDDLAGAQLSEAERQIALLEEQLDQAAEQYDAAVEAENARLDRLIAAEEAQLAEAIAAEEAALDALLEGLLRDYEARQEEIQADSQATIDAITETNGWLAKILDAVNKPYDQNPDKPAEQALDIPGFAAGGTHSGGLRIVGELGPELEYTGPSAITPSADISQVFRAGNADLAAEIRDLRAELRDLRLIATNNAGHNAALLKIHKRWDGEGAPPDRMDYAKTLAEAV